jgi:hypothetical protein
VAAGSDVVVMLTGGVVISMLNGLDAVAPALSVTVAVNA